MKKIPWSTSPIRFVLVGLVNTAWGTAMMLLFYNALHWGYWTATAVSYLICGVGSYLLNRYWTFRYHGRGAALRFALCVAVCYAAAYGLARPLLHCLLAGAGQNLRENGAMLAGMCLFTGLNYLGQRLFVFPGKRDGLPHKRQAPKA